MMSAEMALKAFGINELGLGAKHSHQHLQSQFVCPSLELLEQKVLAPSIRYQTYVDFNFSCLSVYMAALSNLFETFS